MLQVRSAPIAVAALAPQSVSSEVIPQGWPESRKASDARTLMARMTRRMGGLLQWEKRKEGQGAVLDPQGGGGPLDRMT